ncbi:MAG: YlxM family DNA-binding protein [Lachnospiraceae bacterium]|nr:YlxM family DNA-binding protein [Lachnospiraceae bacterium]
MERFVEQALLYDFYGELLTDNQKQVFEDVILNDYSLTEVAEEKGISRQGVHDLIKRTNKLLLEYEEKLHLVEKFLHIKEKVHHIHAVAEQAEEIEKAILIQQIQAISNEILEEL